MRQVQSCFGNGDPALLVTCTDGESGQRQIVDEEGQEFLSLGVDERNASNYFGVALNRESSIRTSISALSSGTDGFGA